jgi:hypothetical protein
MLTKSPDRLDRRHPPARQHALAVKNLLGAKIKLVSGYQARLASLAINRGRFGICGLSMSSVTAVARRVQSGRLQGDPAAKRQTASALAGVPHVDRYAKTAEDGRFGLIFGAQALGRIYGSTPGIPAERRSALRAAFMATMSDPQFLSDAAKSAIDVNPTSGAEVEAFIASMASSSPDVVERARRATRAD